MCICNSAGELSCTVKSSLDPHFLKERPHLNKPLEAFLSRLFKSDMRGPENVGDGIVLGIECCYGNPYQDNIERPSYVRQNYGLTYVGSQEKRDEMLRNASECARNISSLEGVDIRHTYGSGSGNVTHGQLPQ